MAKENEGVELEVVPEIVATQDDDGNDTTNWKEIAEAQNKSAKQYEGLAKRNHTDLKKLKEDPRLKEEVKPTPKPDTKPEKKDGFDRTDKAFLLANGIKASEYDFVLERQGKHLFETLDALVESDVFQSELKSHREEQTSKDGIPKGNKRATPTSVDQVDHWINKEDDKGNPVLPKDRELAKKVVEARIKSEKSKSKFTDNPVV